MPYRPDDKQSFKNGATPPWLGFQNAKILSFTDESSKFEWADVYLIIELQTAGSEYPVKMRLSGSFERDTDGSLMNNPLLKKFYSVADAIGFGGGFDMNGNWVSKVDESIDNIASFLNNNYTDNTGAEIYPYTIYVYKKKVLDKTTNEEKVWTEVVQRMAKSEDRKQMKSLNSYVQWAKDNDIIKEHIEEPEPEPWDETSTSTSSAPTVSLKTGYKAN